MARPKKINEKTGKPFRTDRELVYQYQHSRKKEKKLDAAYELWDKYFLLRKKMQGELASLCRRNNLYMPELYEEYDSEAWEKFINQMDGVRLDDVEHLPNWSIYIRLWGYWRSMNRDILKKWFDWNINTTPIYSLNDNNENGQSGLTNLDVMTSHNASSIDADIDIKDNQSIFWESIDVLKGELNEGQRKLLNMKSQGFSNPKIITTLGTTKKIFNDNLAFIKQRLNSIITVTAKKKGIQSDYNTLLQSFGGS